jgi:GTP-binding protein HflX
MIDAFKSTLEESLQADLILLLVDSSEDLKEIQIKYSSCWDVLKELNVDRTKVLVVLSKFDDGANDQKIDEITKDLQLLQEPMVISSKTGHGTHKLKNTIKQFSKAGKQ